VATVSYHPARLTARLLRRAANTLDRLAKTQTWIMKHPRRDMSEDVDEQYYAKQYMHWLSPLLAQLPSRGRVLDLGCGHGRLALEVAAHRHDCILIGVDPSPPSIAGATAHATERGLKNCEFHEGGIGPYLERAMVEWKLAESVNLVLYVEASFFGPQNPSILQQIARVLKPGGYLFASFRSQWFNLVASVAYRHFESARLVRDKREGLLWGGGNVFSWHTPADIHRELLDAGLTPQGPCRGLGILSALKIDYPGPPVPSTLEQLDQMALLDLELTLAEAYAAQGRYLVAIARKE
jgi:SAM-dependent methyltransferase